MSLPVQAGDPTLPDAMAALLAAQSENAPETIAPATITPDSATEPPIAPVEPPKEDGQPPEPKPGDTPGAPATTESDKGKQPEAEKEPKEILGKEAKSYAKNEERKQLVWNQIKAEKEAVRLEQDRFKAEKEAFQRERLAFDKKMAESSKSNFKPPEFYENGAAQMERAAKIAEERGEFDKADEFKAEAIVARKHAKWLRENPPEPDPTAEETQKAFGEEQKKWTAKAGLEFPDLLKKVKGDDGKETESPSMQRLMEMITPGSKNYDQVVHEAVRTSPAGMYYASMLAHNITVAARVPTLEKELADARAEVKKLNGKLSVNGGGLANGQPAGRDFTSLTLEEQEEQLRAQAAGRKSW